MAVVVNLDLKGKPVAFALEFGWLDAEGLDNYRPVKYSVDLDFVAHKCAGRSSNVELVELIHVIRF